MDLRDARKLSPAELEDRWKLAVKLRKSGKTYVEVAEIVGVIGVENSLKSSNVSSPDPLLMVALGTLFSWRFKILEVV